MSANTIASADSQTAPNAMTTLTSRAPGPAGRRTVVRRILLAPALLLGVSFLVFVLIDLSPNDPAYAELGTRASEERRAQYASEHGLDDPLIVRYGRFLGDLLRLDLGASLVRSESVGELIHAALQPTVQLVIVSSLITVTLAGGLGMIAARHEGRLADRVISSTVAVFAAMPSFWIGVLFIQLFAVSLGIFPAGGYTPVAEGIGPWFSSIIGPAIVLALPLTAGLTRILRGSVADELSKDYVLTAQSAGIPGPVVLCRNVLRNALIPPLTTFGLYIGTLMSGAVVVEVVFNIPGMGMLLVNGVGQGDLGVVRAVALIGAAAFIAVNLVTDLLYLVLNPRSAEVSNV